MYIKKFRVNNYKSFLNTDEIELFPGFNVIVGKNNSGKTALIELLSMGFLNKPHRSLKTMPNPRIGINEESSIDITINISRTELEEIFINHKDRIIIPHNPDYNKPQIKVFTKSIQDQNLFITKYTPSGFRGGYLESYGNFGYGKHFVLKPYNENKKMFDLLDYHNGGTRYIEPILNAFKKQIYFFKAERFNISEHVFGDQTTLTPNASNLPVVLYSLLGRNISRFDRLSKYVSVIFPDVKRVSVRPKEEQIEIITWTIDPYTERENLVIPLTESGTGLGQVIAMLYVVLTSDSSKVIIIDEPQSFLHPGAIRKLLDILNEISKNTHNHQFIIATHSPTIINSIKTKSIILLTKESAESKIESIDTNDTNKIKIYLSEIGAKLADVFGADDIIWVEGKTEEICYPMIIEKLCTNTLRGTEILGVRNTGDLEGKDAKKVYEIYTKLSEGKNLIPPAIAFIFDEEGKTINERRDLERQSGGLVEFIPRRMYENYLLNSKAISEVASNIKGFKEDDDKVSENEILDWISKNKWDKKYFIRLISEDKQTQENWLKKVNGAQILNDIFKDISENRVIYRKTEHSVAITEWLLDNAPEDLKDIAEFLDKKLKND